MYTYTKQLISTLSSILPAHYELFCNSSTPKPCITIKERNNASEIEGNTLRYSKLSYFVKVWGNDIDVVEEKAAAIDDTMIEEGFVRTMTETLIINTEICKILSYESRALEGSDCWL